MSKAIMVLDSYSESDQHVVDKVEENIGFTFPALYKTLMKSFRGGRISLFTDLFEYYQPDYEETVVDNVTFTQLVGDCSVEEDFHIIKNLWGVKNLVPISDNGGGDMICLDYREDPKSIDPPIVNIIHDDWNDDETQKIYFVAENFRAFLHKLYGRGEERYQELCEIRKEDNRALPFEWPIPECD